MKIFNLPARKLFFGGSIEPEELVSFNNEYHLLLPRLHQFLEEHLGKLVEIPSVRINGDGSTQRKLISGRVIAVRENSFTLLSNKDFSGGSYESPMRLHIRMDNVLGIVPLMQDNPDMDPFVIGGGENLKEYFECLEGMRTLMQICIGLKHAGTLWYRYSKKHPMLREGKYRVECELLEVNKSNVKYKHVRTFAHLPGSHIHDYVDLIPREDFDRYIAPDRYLVGFSVTFGESQPNRLHDG